MKAKQSTTTLLRLIAGAPSLNHALRVKQRELTLPQHLQSLLEVSGLSIPVLVRQTLISKPFLYQIFGGIRKPGRNVLLRLAFAMGLSLEETQRLLTVARRCVLYPRLRRDAALIFMLEHSYTLAEADEALRSIGEQPLLSEIS